MRVGILWAGGPSSLVVEAMPEALATRYEWRVLWATGDLVWHCHDCGRDYEPHDIAAWAHSRKHDEARAARERRLAEGIAERQAAVEREIAARAEEHRAKTRAGIERRRQALRAEREAIAAEEARRRALHRAAEAEGDPGVDYMIPILLDRREYLDDPHEQQQRFGMLNGARRIAGLRRPEWRGRLHRRHCVCTRCAERYPERLADADNWRRLTAR